MQISMKLPMALLFAIGLTVAIAGLAGCKTAGTVTYHYPSGRSGGP